MKNLTLILLCFSSFAYGLTPNTKQKLSSHLLEVNKNWKNQDVSKIEEVVSFNSDIDRIQKHLFSVIELLQAKKTHFSQNQLENRLNFLNELYSYAEKKVFPINLFHKERTPYFIDYLGTHCAVGYLMLVSGNGDLAQKISKNENYAYVKDIETKGVGEWAEIHGFSLEELALIQPTYQNPASYENIDGTTNGPVKHLLPSYNQLDGSRLYFGGDFTELKGLPCANIGFYQNNQLSCLAGGLNGKLVDIKNATGGQLIACGEFLHNGEKYQIAKLVNNTWEFSALPISEEFEVLAFDAFSGSLNDSQYRMSVAIHKLNSINTEIWSFDDNSNWKKRAETNGGIYAIESRNYSNAVYGGKFDKVYLFQNDFLTDSLIVNNVVKHDINFTYDNSIQGIVPDTINSIMLTNTGYYFGGRYNDFNFNSLAISEYVNGYMQPLIFSGTICPMVFEPRYMKINAMNINTNTSQFLFAGNFTAGYMYLGQGLATYDFLTGYVYAINNFYGELYDLVYFENRYYYVGGSNFGQNPFGYIVRELSSIGISENQNLKLTISPNPSSDRLKIEGLNAVSTYEVVDQMGEIVQSGTVINNEINIEKLASATYILSIKQENEIVHLRFLKN
jgi:hypothetical protein